MHVPAKRAPRRRRLSSPIVILAGGEGTRLRPLTLTRPKSMIPLGNAPVIDHLISRISESGFNNFVVTVNYEKEQVMNHLGYGDRFGVKINYAVEPEGIFLGTAGSVKIADHLLKETFMIVQGDAFTTINLKNAMDFHKNSKADVTLILKEVQNPWLFGTVVVDDDGLIKEFQEKPQKGQELSNLISTGIYCLEPEVLDFITPGECDFAKNVFPNLLNEGKRLIGYAGKGFWADIGSLDGYLEGARQVLESHILSQKLKPISESMIGRKVIMGEKVIIKQPALVEDKVNIGRNCQIGPYVVLKNGVKIGERSIIENSTVFEKAEIGSFSRIYGSILGEQSKIDDNVFVDGSVIGPGSILEQSVQIKNGGRVWPGIRVNSNTIVHGTLALPTDQPFHFRSYIGRYTGYTAATIEELMAMLKKVEVKSIEFHFYRRDFERWVRDAFKANVLSRRISDFRHQGLRGRELRKGLINLINNWMEYSTEREKLLYATSIQEIK